MSRYLALAFTLALPASALAQTTAPAPPAASPSPATEVPRIRNLAEVVRVLQAAYPADLRDAGIGGSVQMRMLVDTAGQPNEFQIVQGSGKAQLDSAALNVATVLRFYPATVDGKPVPLRATVPIRFVPEADSTSAATTPTEATPAPVSQSSSPTYVLSAVEKAPVLANPTSVRAAMERLYPSRLRLSGVGGDAVVAMMAGVDGVPTEPYVLQGTGNRELDAAALAIARTMRFRPAMVNNRPVPALVRVPITFVADNPDP